MVNPSISPPNTGRRGRFRAQTRAESALPPHPYRLELRGAPRALAWPPLCANCGAGAAERITVRKVFYRRRSSGEVRNSSLLGYRIISARVPFCATCAAQHRAAAERSSALKRIMSVVLHPLILPFAGLAYITKMLLPGVRGASWADPAGRLGLSLTALAGFGAVWTIGLAWMLTRPQHVEEQTEITRACDFSDDVSQPFERQRRIYALRDRTFAEALAAANRDRVWTDEDQASSRRWSTVIFLGILAVPVVVWLYMELTAR